MVQLFSQSPFCQSISTPIGKKREKNPISMELVCETLELNRIYSSGMVTGKSVPNSVFDEVAAKHKRNNHTIVLYTNSTDSACTS